MRNPERVGRALFVTGCLGLSTLLATLSLGKGDGFFKGLFSTVQAAPTKTAGKKGPYALSKAQVVQRTLELIGDEYVDPKRVVPRDLLLAALNAVQRDVAQVLVQVEGGTTARIRADDKEMSIRVDDVKGPWDVLKKIRMVFAFLEVNLRDAPEIDLRDVEYAACNGMLHTLDPHSTLFSPEAYKDFSVTTSGKFGGLGIVIAIRDKQLTVMNTMPGTPAAGAGLQKFDRIVQIQGESTTTMGINEAVQRLRGDPDTDVTLLIHREGKDGWEGTKPFTLTRKEIRVSSVESKSLDDGIGYVRLKQFAESTTADMLRAMAEFKASGHDKGLILDMRGNPGGLLDQAKRVTDAFIKEGTIVISDGRKEGREEMVAKDDKNEPNYPIVVLLNSGSASASEIVAGALKNLDRAVIIGETSFGKGSVQKVERNLPPDGAALKITIAQYLTPGDISIQSVGITPDIELLPMTVDLQELDLSTDASIMRERDLAAHLSNVKAKEGGRPLEVLKYALSREDRAAMRERNGDPDDNFALDFQVSFARRFLKTVGETTDRRVELVKRAKALIGSTRVEEVKKIADDLNKLGVDWSDAPEGALTGFDASKIKVTIEPSKKDAIVAAGEALEFKVTVQNDGTVPLYRLRASTKSDAGIFEGKELVFGKVDPGKSRSWSVPMGWCESEASKGGTTAVRPRDAARICLIPKDAYSRSDVVKFRFEEAREHIPAETFVRTTVKALARPSFAYTYQVADDVLGNGDGLLQIGEKASMYLTVKNVGEGKSYETEASIHNLSGDGLLLRAARFDLSNLAPGEERKVKFSFDVQPALKDTEAKVRLEIRDSDLREGASERVVMPIRPPAVLSKATGSFRSDGTVNLFDSPAEGKPFAELLKGYAIPMTGITGDWLRLDIGSGRVAFAKRSDGKPSPAMAPKLKDNPVMDLLTHSPPRIEVDAIETVVRGDKTKLKGIASDGDRLLDMYVFVGSRKIYYRSNRSGSNPKKLPFDIDLPLRPGVNFVSVWARENAESMQRRVFVIRREGADGTPLETPKSGDDDLLEILGGHE